MIAASAGHEQVVSFLLAKGAQVNAVNNTGQCSLHYAASKDRYQVNINTNVIPLCRQSFVVKCSLIADTSPWMCRLSLTLLNSSTWHWPVSKLFNFSVCMHFLSFFFFWQIHSDRPNEVYSLQQKVLIVSTTWNWLYLLNLGDCMLVRWLWACMHFVQNLQQAVLFLCWSASFHSHQFDTNNVTN